MSNIVEHETNFTFDNVESENVSDLQFYITGDCIYAVWMENNDNGIYMSVSINSGKIFSQSQKVMNTNGNIRDLQILAKDDQFVIALIETNSNQDSKRAVSGWLNIEGRTFSFKPCTSHQVDGKLINIFLSFKERDSIDHMIIKTDDGAIHEIAMGHTCTIKDFKNIQITTVHL